MLNRLLKVTICGIVVAAGVSGCREKTGGAKPPTPPTGERALNGVPGGNDGEGGGGPGPAPECPAPATGKYGLARPFVSVSVKGAAPGNTQFHAQFADKCTTDVSGLVFPPSPVANATAPKVYAAQEFWGIENEVTGLDPNWLDRADLSNWLEFGGDTEPDGTTEYFPAQMTDCPDDPTSSHYKHCSVACMAVVEPSVVNNVETQIQFSQLATVARWLAKTDQTCVHPEETAYEAKMERNQLDWSYRTVIDQTTVENGRVGWSSAHTYSFAATEAGNRRYAAEIWYLNNGTSSVKRGSIPFGDLVNSDKPKMVVTASVELKGACVDQAGSVTPASCDHVLNSVPSVGPGDSQSPIPHFPAVTSDHKIVVVVVKRNRQAQVH